MIFFNLPTSKLRFDILLEILVQIWMRYSSLKRETATKIVEKWEKNAVSIFLKMTIG